MTIRCLALAGACAAALSAPAAAATGDVRMSVCEKSCLAPHEKSLSDCKVFQSSDESRRCASRADARKSHCERSCRDRAEARVRKAERERDERDARDAAQDKRERFQREQDLGPHE